MNPVINVMMPGDVYEQHVSENVCSVLYLPYLINNGECNQSTKRIKDTMTQSEYSNLRVDCALLINGFIKLDSYDDNDCE